MQGAPKGSFTALESRETATSRLATSYVCAIRSPLSVLPTCVPSAPPLSVLLSRRRCHRLLLHFLCHPVSGPVSQPP